MIGAAEPMPVVKRCHVVARRFERGGAAQKFRSLLDATAIKQHWNLSRKLFGFASHSWQENREFPCTWSTSALTGISERHRTSVRFTHL